MNRSRLHLVAGLAVALLPATPLAQQDLGHKTLGAVGLDAGSQAEPGLYAVERALFYRADEVVDRNGHPLPVGIDLDAFGNGIGVIGVIRVRPLSTYLSAAIALPIAHVTVNTDRPEASLDRFGLGDVYVQPIRLGWRWSRFDLGVGYGFYAPTGRFEPGGQDGVGRGHWTHQFSLGGTAYLDPERTWNVSAIASYDLNQRKQDIDITRGATVQIQGGAGVTLLRLLELGVAGFALWQVQDDRGADLPRVLRGARDRIYGLGPEADVLIPPIRSKLTVRWEHELGARARPQGQVLVFGLTFVALGGKRPADRSR